MKKLLFIFGFLLFLGIGVKANAASLELTYPNGGEELKGGETYEFTWTQENIKKVSITLKRSDGIVMEQAVYVDVDTSASEGSYQYTIPDKENVQGEDDYLISIYGYLDDTSDTEGSNSDESDGYFTIYRDKADLVITDFKVGMSQGFSPPTYDNIFAGEVMAFTVYVDNVGNDLFSYHNDVKIEIGDITCNIGYLTAVPGYVTCRNAITLEVGSYEATAIIDASDEIDESDETNNTMTVSFEVADFNEYVEPINECQPVIPRPEGHYHENCVDMIIEDIVVSPDSPKVDGSTTITVKGSTDETGGTVTTTSLERYDYSFEDFVVSNVELDTGEPFTVIRDFEYIFTGHFTSTGDKELYFKVDHMNRKDEMSESNNDVTETVAVVDSDSDDSDDSDDDDSAVEKITICHRTGNGGGNTLEIAESAWPAHEAHGDTLGVCGSNDDDDSDDSDDSDDDDNTPVKKPKRYINQVLTQRMKGRILLQVEDHGEAWYVRPDNGKRMYMKDGSTAYGMMRNLGLGISNADLKKIPIGIEKRFECLDSDGDGLCNKLEEGLGTDPGNPDSDGDGFDDGQEIDNDYDPVGNKKFNYDNSLVNRLRGQILLQVESRGEAWYINPDDGKRYYMTDGPAAYQIMRFLSLGIANADLDQIDTE